LYSYWATRHIHWSRHTTVFDEIEEWISSESPCHFHSSNAALQEERRASVDSPHTFWKKAYSAAAAAIVCCNKLPMLKFFELCLLH
jgi:anti-sigma-K factor RskA